MNAKKVWAATAMAAVMTVAMMPVARAADDSMMKSAAPASEKCYGVAKAGKNDCRTSAHSCAGHAAKDADPSEWLLLPAGVCAKLADGVVK